MFNWIHYNKEFIPAKFIPDITCPKLFDLILDSGQFGWNTSKLKEGFL
jgi:hypothetical protein